MAAGQDAGGAKALSVAEHETEKITIRKCAGMDELNACVALQKEVWTFAKRFAQSMEKMYPDLVTAEYKVAKRPEGHVLVDYNQNAWGRTLSSVYSIRPKPFAPVSTPVTWDEVQSGFKIEDFRIDNVRERVAQLGDLWAPVASPKGRVNLEALL